MKDRAAQNTLIFVEYLSGKGKRHTLIEGKIKKQGGDASV
jgi:hypothetical protein